MIILTDIHEEIEKADIVINQYPNETFILLGDYFDKKFSAPSNSYKVAEWVKSKLYDKRFTLLWGNHDLPYAFPDNYHVQCGGYNKERQYYINKVLNAEDWNKFKWFTSHKNWLFSHAGINKNHAKSIEELNFHVNEATNCLKSARYHRFFDASSTRGGRLEPGKGGIVWEDWSEFKPYAGYNQIIGHTPGAKPRWKKGKKTINLNINVKEMHYVIIDIDKNIVSTHKI